MELWSLSVAGLGMQCSHLVPRMRPSGLMSPQWMQEEWRMVCGLLWSVPGITNPSRPPSPSETQRICDMLLEESGPFSTKTPQALILGSRGPKAGVQLMELSATSEIKVTPEPHCGSKSPPPGISEPLCTSSILWALGVGFRAEGQVGAPTLQLGKSGQQFQAAWTPWQVESTCSFVSASYMLCDLVLLNNPLGARVSL